MMRQLKEFYFTIDLRSLGLYRVLLAGLLIVDWFARWPDLEAFYTWFGVLPVDAPLPKSGGDFHFSLLDGVTTLPMVRAVFCVGLVLYVLFLIGFRTRIVHFLSFLFFVSVQNRNVMIRDGSDVVMATMLMWSLFLPMGKRFSLDAIVERMRRGVVVTRRPPTPPAAERCEPSLAALVIVAQIGLIYFFTAFAKYGDTWKGGTALYYALNFDQLVRPLGRWLAAQPLPLIKRLTWGVLTVEFAALPLTLAPVAQPWLRRSAMAALAAMHIGIALTMDIGLFPMVMIATYALLLLPEDWMLLGARPRPVTVYYDDTCGFCHRCAQLLVIADRMGNLQFIGNHDPAAFRHELSQAELQSSIVVIEASTGERTKRAAAAATIFRVLPWPFRVCCVIAWPGARVVSDRVYDLVSRNRYRFSQWLGFTACGVGRVSEDVVVTATVPPAAARAWRRAGRVAANLIVAVIFVTLTVDSYNLNMTKRLGCEPIREPRWMRAIVLVPLTEHDWELFAPDPAMDDGWWVIDGETESGEKLDPLTGKVPTFERPADLASRFDRFWRKYLYRVWLKKNFDYRLYFGKYITRKNHREAPKGKRLVRFYFYYVEELTQPPGTPRPWPTKRVMLWHHECFEGARN